MRGRANFVHKKVPVRLIPRMCVHMSSSSSSGGASPRPLKETPPLRPRQETTKESQTTSSSSTRFGSCRRQLPRWLALVSAESWLAFWGASRKLAASPRKLGWRPRRRHRRRARAGRTSPSLPTRPCPRRYRCQRPRLAPVTAYLLDAVPGLWVIACHFGGYHRQHGPPSDVPAQGQPVDRKLGAALDSWSEWRPRSRGSACATRERDDQFVRPGASPCSGRGPKAG